jgi:PAS domain S-box-containing protein
MIQREKNEYGQNQSDRNELILQSLSEGICVVDAERKITFANPAAALLFGCEPSELLEKNYDLAFFHQDKTLSAEDLAVCPIQFALTVGATSHINTETFFRADGEDFLVEYVCAPIFEDVEITGAVVTFQDITERRDIEAIISQARESALETARTKAVFLANMSHEIRTPLSGIVGTANLLLDTHLTDEQRQYLQILQKSVGLLMETVNDILDFSKIEAGKFALETIDFNLRETVEESINLFKVPAVKKKLNLSFTVENDISDGFRGDENRLRQVLNNLLNNAIKFTESGEISLSISKLEANNLQTILRFEVADTGIGIDAEEKMRLFQPFTQADVSTTRRFGGTGLGLAICKEIVEMMGGEIGVESEIGKGSRFWFTVALVSGFRFQVSGEDELGIAGNTEFTGNDQKLGTWNLKPETIKILIVDDNEINREVTRKLLEHIGYECETAENGAEAVKKCAETKFDLILMDCQMPEMDGFTATKTIRQTEKTHHPKIIALTANSAETEHEKCLRAGMDDYLCKPVTKNDLIEILNKHFSTEKVLSNLDLEENIVQHSLAELIAPEILKSFLEIESRGEKNFTFEILQIYCQNAEEQISELQNDFLKRDAKSIERRAHSLKGSSANAGLEKLTKHFEILESVVDSKNWKRIENLLANISQDFENIKHQTYLRENL